MPNRFSRIALLLGVFACCASFAWAEEDSPSESAQELMKPPAAAARHRWETTLDGVWWPRSDSSDAGGKVGLAEARVRVSRSFSINKRLKLTPEATYSQLEVSAPTAARLPGSLYTASLGLRADYFVNPGFSYSVLVAPGLAGDFRAIGTDDLRVRLGFIGRFTSSQRLTLLAGLIYQPGDHSLPVFPILGAIYRPDDRWTISIAAPRPGVSYAVDPDLKLNLYAEYFGGEFQLHQADLGAQVVRYRDVRTSGGVEWTLTDQLKGELAAGYAFARKFTFYDEFAGGHADVSVDPGPFARATLKLQW